MNAEARVATGVAGLDAMLHGGFIRESAILVRGAPGTGKTTLGFHYLLEGAGRGERGLFVSFEEFPQSLYRDAQSLGWNLAQYETDGLLHLMFTSPQVLVRSIESPDSPLMQTLLTHNIQRVVVDSLTHFTRLTADTQALRQMYNKVVNAFQREGTTAMFLGEEMRSDFTAEEKGRLSFVVDCIVMLRYLEIESAIQRALLVLKMRSSDHDKAIHSYTIGPGGMVVGEPLEGRTGLLNALARHSMISSVQSAR
ncbi:MAG: AAA family ATPase [Anaerolineae bacterium]|nr:AAA family ATPase [Anaerolineae bacterium]